MSVEIVTFGCRLNAFESEVIRHQAEAAGLPDAVVINTCAVTNEAVRQARQAIRRVKRERPNARIIVTGCAAQTAPLQFADMAEVDRVLGNDEKMKGDAWRTTRAALAAAPEGLARADKVAVADIMTVTDTAPHLVDGFADRARAFVQVQNGCDHRCTFCIIPYGRGNSRSTPMGAIVDQARKLVAAGFAEIVLTGVDLTSYGADLPGTPKLGSLARQILKHVPELPRLRISSLDMIEADRDLMDLIANDERLMPHLHLSLQAGDDLILKRMKRRHSRADAIRFCDEVRRLRPGIVLGADIIAGFPTEDEAHFRQSLDLVDACGLTLLHVFPYSPRPGTPAARMPQLDRGLIKERARRLREKGDAALRMRLAAEIGAVRQILMESPTEGRSEHFLPVRVRREGAAGEVRALEITASTSTHLIAG